MIIFITPILIFIQRKQNYSHWFFQGSIYFLKFLQFDLKGIELKSINLKQIRGRNCRTPFKLLLSDPDKYFHILKNSP